MEQRIVGVSGQTLSLFILSSDQIHPPDSLYSQFAFMVIFSPSAPHLFDHTRTINSSLNPPLPPAVRKSMVLIIVH